MFATFTWDAAGDEFKIVKVLDKFEQYCQPCQNIPFERHRFNQRVQEPGESHDQYCMVPLKIADGNSFQTITPAEILCDRLAFGIKDQQARP